MKKFVVSLMVIGLFASLASCGGTDDGSGDAGNEDGGPMLASIADLPRATGPVTTSQTAKAAVLPLGTADASSFDAQSSLGACELLNNVQALMATASTPDARLCILDFVESSGTFASSGVDIYDGGWHTFDLSYTDDAYLPDRVKVRAMKNDSGSIVSLEMFMCADGSQTQYMLYDISGSTCAMEATGNYTRDGEGGWHDIHVQGTLTTSGTFADKTIVSRGSGIRDGDRQWQEATFEQGPTSFTFSGYSAGVWAEGGSEGTFGNSIHGRGALEDANASFASDAYDPGLLAMGDGAALYTIAGTVGEASYEPDPGLEAWDGATMQVLADPSISPYYTDVMGQQPPTPTSTSIVVDFDDDQTWDCTGEADAVLPLIDSAEVNTYCGHADLDHSWINCWQITSGT